MKRLDLNIIAVAIIFSATAFFIAVLFKVSFQPNNGQSSPSHHSQQYDNRTDEQQPPERPTVVQVEDRIEPESSSNISQRSNQESGRYRLQDYDHYSQITMAALAILGLIVGVVGLIFLWRTVVYTKRAAASSDKAMEVAGETLEETKRSARLELQPYLSAVVTDLKSGAMRETETHYEFPVILSVRIENVGKTPALGLFMNIGAKMTQPRSFGEVNKVGFRGDTIYAKRHASKMSDATLGAGDHTDETIPITFSFAKSEFDGANNGPSVQRSRFAFGLRLSYTDDFTSILKIDGRYGRRVMSFDFGTEAFGDSFGVPEQSHTDAPKDVDYPEEHNKREPFIPHAYYGSGTLSLIKLRDLPDSS